MRISDWSSDVCSSDLAAGKAAIAALPGAWETRIRLRRGSTGARALELIVSQPILTAKVLAAELDVSFQAASSALNALARAGILRERTGHGRDRLFAAEEVIAILRSEEHTSELQSLMRISYAVYSLKKKK